MKTKVLILHTSVGHGIKATAVNIGEKLKASGKYEVRIEDVQKIIGGKSNKFLEKFYLRMLEKFAFVWGFLYTSKLIMWISLPLRKPIARFKSKNVLRLLREYQPAIVISTQTISTGITAYLKSNNLYLGKLVAVFSDFHTHPFWIYDEVDLYLCAIAEQAGDLATLGIPKDKIAVTGMILSEKFNNQIGKDEARREAGLMLTMPVVLLFNGARPRMAVRDLFLRLLRSPKSFQILVVCALNQELKDELEIISPPAPHPVKILGYANNVDVLMSASDVLIGKTGGPTMGEAILKKLPIILTDINPGHEQINLEYLIRNGIAQYARNPAEATFFTEQILDGKLHKDWKRATSKLIHPTEAVSVPEAIDRIRPQDLDKTGGLTIKNYQANI
jgi:processive 1,2-diacylglycerol beta-glucosyltransferase